MLWRVRKQVLRYLGTLMRSVAHETEKRKVLCRYATKDNFSIMLMNKFIIVTAEINKAGQKTGKINRN